MIRSLFCRISPMLALLAATSPAPASDLIWSASPAGDAYSLRMGARLPLAVDASFGTDVGFAGETTVSTFTSPAVAPPSKLWGKVRPPEGANIFATPSLDLQYDPALSTGSVEMAATKSIDLGAGVSASLRDSYKVNYGEVAGTPASMSTAKSVRLDYGTFGTAVMAETAWSERDARWATSLRAEQRVFGGVTVSSSFDNIGSGAPGGSLKARYSRGW